MACSSPMLLYRKDRQYQYYDLSYRTDNYIPCGRCLNCRVDKINSYTHRCEAELIKRRSGAFVTFTYDDYHILHLLRTNSSGKKVATLSKFDCKKFLDRLNKLVHSQSENVLCQHDYKYIIAGEYGEHGQQFDRPHFHAIFFGLDYAYCKKLFARAWRGQGSIKVLPIKNGAPRYLLDYISCLEYGEQRKIKYDHNNLEAPFQTHSLGLGTDLYFNQLEYIKTHDNCYRWHGKDVPVPTYWRNKFLLPKNSVYKKYQTLKFKAIHEGNYSDSFENLLLPDTISKLRNYELQQSKNREKNLKIKMVNNGRAIVDRERLSYDLHDYKQKNNLYYRSTHPSPLDLGLPYQDTFNLYKEYSSVNLSDMVDLALYGDLVPF